MRTIDAVLGLAERLEGGKMFVLVSGDNTSDGLISILFFSVHFWIYSWKQPNYSQLLPSSHPPSPR